MSVSTRRVRNDYLSRSRSIEMRHQLLLLILVNCCSIIGLVDTAEARRGIPIIWGSGPTIKEVGKLPPEVAPDVREVVGANVTVGYMYHHFHLFYLDFWTWEGEHVLFKKDEYWQLEDADWQDILGEHPRDAYGVPWQYRIPLGAAIIALLIAAYIAKKSLFPSEDERVEKLLKQPRYQRAIDTVFGSGDDENAKLTTSLDSGKFTRAADSLVEDGVKPDAAESNLRLLVDRVLASTNARIDGSIAYAQELRESGELDESKQLYEQLVQSLPHDDARYDQVQSELNSFRDSTAEQIDETETDADETTHA